MELEQIPKCSSQSANIFFKQSVSLPVISNHTCSYRAVILVVDSVNFDKEVSDVAGLLYDLLSDPVIHKKRISLLVACNKQDLTLARRAEAITKHLEKEM